MESTWEERWERKRESDTCRAELESKRRGRKNTEEGGRDSLCSEEVKMHATTVNVLQ